MAGEINTIRDAIRYIAKLDDPYSVVCKVYDIDLNTMLCNCEPLEDSSAEDKSAVLIGIKINADNKTGFVLVPKDESIVVVTLTSNVDGFISMVSDVDEIYLNGNNHDGLVKVGDLVTKLNNLENKVNEIIGLYNTHVHVETSGSTLPTTSIVSGVLIPTIQANLENTTVKHGS